MTRTTIFDDLNNLFNQNFVSYAKIPARLNILESANTYEVEIAAAGMNRNDLKIELRHDDLLEITFDKKKDESADAQDRKVIRQGFRTDNSTQTLLIPKDVDKKQISARMEDGILYITLPKKSEEQEQDEKKYIQVQ